MESERALAAMEKRRLMDLARVVPETLLHVGTTEVVFASIKAARDLLGEDKWGCDDDADHPESNSSSEVGDGHDVGGVPLNTPCGILAGLRYDDMAPAPQFSFSAGLQYDYAPPAPALSCDLRNDDEASAPNLSSGLGNVVDDSDPDCWANLLATALAPEGHLPEAYSEITHLVSLHGETGRVLFPCATRLGIQSGGKHTPGGQPDDDAAWKRWRDLRKSVVRHAHDALLRLKNAASAVAAAEDFIRWRSLESPGRNEWSSAARQLVGDARRSLDEAKESVRLMRDAVVHEYFETWMILNRVAGMLEANL